MKLKILVIVLLLIVSSYPQVREIESRTYFNQGDFEVNFSLNLGVGFTSYEISNTNQSPYYNDYGGRPFIFLISAAMGYCVIDGLSVEPEFDINLIMGDSEISTAILINAVYNFNIPRKSIYPFIKLGYGISNYIPDYYYYNSSADNSLNTGVINIGAGLNIAYSSGMALKLEINYKRYNSTTSVDYYDYNTYEPRVEDLSLLAETLTFSMGYSIIF